ncbi:MAG TPA: diphthine--ammonia ligase [Nitrosopumilaceae archaeon]|nr:diphthine--ammonia ligase [Nitrosopumilaceae archaeon]
MASKLCDCTLNLTALFSGGKDSTFAIYKEKQNGNNIMCAVTVFPESDESTFLHYPNVHVTKLQTKSMKIPHFFSQTNSNDVETEMQEIQKLLAQAKKDYPIEGLVHGGILSKFQKERFEKIGLKLNLKIFSPLWQINQKEYLKDLIEAKFRFIITSVSSAGLDESWLGKEITMQDVEKLDELAVKHGFNLSFEGGEAETLVLDCPLFSSPIKIINSKKSWDGYRGRFEITEAILEQ